MIVGSSGELFHQKIFLKKGSEDEFESILTGRRHSSCEVQSWDRLVLQAEPSSSCSSLAPLKDSSGGNSLQQTAADPGRIRRYGSVLAVNLGHFL